MVDKLNAAGDAGRKTIQLKLRYNGFVSYSDRKSRAEQRGRRAVISRHRLGDDEVDHFPVRGVEAISLATRISREAWSLSGRAWPDYSRSDTPYRFVDGFPE